MLVDYEFTGLFLPSFDLAMLHTLLARTPSAQYYIEGIVSGEGLDAQFTVSQAMVLSRELRIHAELPAGVEREQCLELLREQWARFQNRLHTQ